MRALILGILAALLLPALPGVCPSDAVQLSRRRVSRGDRRSSGRSYHRRRARPEYRPPERLLDPDVLAARETDISRLIAGRLHLAADGALLTAGPWSDADALAERQSVRLQSGSRSRRPAGRRSTRMMFPYDPQHQTFINFYEATRSRSRRFSTRRRPRSNTSRDAARGLGGHPQVRTRGNSSHPDRPGPPAVPRGPAAAGRNVRQLALVVTRVHVAHSITLSLAALNLVNPPARIIEPAIALSIVYVGADNLWCATAGTSAPGSRSRSASYTDSASPTCSAKWTCRAWLSAGRCSRSTSASKSVNSSSWSLWPPRWRRCARAARRRRRLAFAGSVAVIAAGAFWFIQRCSSPALLA